jgi:hypothetical protein
MVVDHMVGQEEMHKKGIGVVVAIVEHRKGGM